MTITRHRKSQRILVIGGVAAGPSAAAKAKRINPYAEVILFEQGNDISYGVCELPYLISGEIPSPEKLIFFTPDSLEREKGVKVYTRHRVEKIHPAQRFIEVRNLNDSSLKTESYDKMIIATGCSSRRLSVFPSDASNVFYLKTLQDGRDLITFIQTTKPKSVCILGAGYIGLETAEAFHSAGLDVSLINDLDYPLPSFEIECRKLVTDILQKKGIRLFPNREVLSVSTRHNRVLSVQTSSGTISADLFLVAVGFTPNVEIFRQAGIRIGQHGGILTDQRQATNIDGIFAAGDCAEVLNLVTRKHMLMPFASVASKTGRVAGENAAGGSATLKGFVPTSALTLFEYEIAQTGAETSMLKMHGFSTVKSSIVSTTRVKFMPGAEPILITLSADRRTHYILNANIIAKEHAAQRINTIAMAIHNRMTVDDLLNCDFVYTPKLAPLWDPILICAQQLKKKLTFK